MDMIPRSHYDSYNKADHPVSLKTFVLTRASHKGLKEISLFYPVRIVFQKFLPICLATCTGKRVAHLIVVT